MAARIRPSFTSRSTVHSSFTHRSSSSLPSATPASSPFSGLVQRRHKSCGIVGLPNVGKSTLFNALTDTQLAEASNYPFCTIEPNTANVAVPDPLLVKLAALAKTDKIIFGQMKFVDIAGIIAGASAGAGLGNKFLSNIRECDILLQVVRCFDDSQIVHVDSRIDPLADIEVIETELILADLQTIEKRIENLEKGKNKKEPPSAIDRLSFYKRIRTALDAGIFACDLALDSPEEQKELDALQLITSKRIMYVCNVDENAIKNHNQYTKAVYEHVEKFNNTQVSDHPSGVRVSRVPRAVLRVCAQVESEVQAFDTLEARKEYLESLDLEDTSLSAVITTANKLLNTQTYYTVGVQEARAWTIEVGTNAQQAAGKIHSDLMKGFVCAEVITPEDYIKYEGDAGARQAGKMRVEGKAYIVNQGDIMLFRCSGQKGR